MSGRECAHGVFGQGSLATVFLPGEVFEGVLKSRGTRHALAKV